MGYCFLDAYWGSRQESIDECTDRAFDFVGRFKAVHPFLSSWALRAMSYEEAQKRVVDMASREAVRHLLAGTRNRRDTDKAVVEELGYYLHLWNGGPPNLGLDASLDVHCGAYGAWARNYVKIDLAEAVVDALGWEGVWNALQAVVEAWAPERAGPYSTASLVQNEYKPPQVGWMVFTQKQLKSVPYPATLHDVPAGGSIVVVKAQPPSLDNGEDVMAIRRIDELVS